MTPGKPGEKGKGYAKGFADGFAGGRAEGEFFMAPVDSIKYLVKSEIRDVEVKWLGKIMWFGGIVLASTIASLVASLIN